MGKPSSKRERRRKKREKRWARKATSFERQKQALENKQLREHALKEQKFKAEGEKRRQQEYVDKINKLRGELGLTQSSPIIKEALEELVECKTFKEAKEVFENLKQHIYLKALFFYEPQDLVNAKNEMVELTNLFDVFVNKFGSRRAKTMHNLRKKLGRLKTGRRKQT